MILASEALRAEQINMASGEAEAILVRANATAKGIDAVARSMRDGKESAQGAVSFSVAEKYVEAFGKLAKEGTAVVVPGNVGDMGGMIASAMAVYGKVSEGQAKIAANAARISGPESGDSSEMQNSEQGGMGKTDEVAQSVLQGFEETRKKR